MKDKSIVALWCASLLTIVFTVNTVFHGPDGLIASGIIGAIAGLGGFALGKR